MKQGDFRIWVQNIWRENCTENFVWGDPVVSLETYFARYKWWLRREYRHRQK